MKVIYLISPSYRATRVMDNMYMGVGWIRARYAYRRLNFVLQIKFK